MKKNVSRRDFLKTSALTAAGISLGASSLSAASYSRIQGANDRLNFAVLGVHGRGNAHIKSISTVKNAAITHICDVDKRESERATAMTKEILGAEPKQEKDIRKLLEDDSIDVITIATPEHWHAPMAIMGLEAGKHVYVEKPCSHNPAEGEMLIKAQKKYGKLVQMGNQQRSSPHTIEAMRRIHDGELGRPYYGKAFYDNKRGPIGTGKEMPVPDYLDWELWQGPAPRKAYKDIYHPYNWHWFWHWGTGETLNNGTHEVDLCRWALQVGFPKKVTSQGGRYHYNDDWQFYDTLVTSFEYDDAMITWEGTSCNAMKHYGRGRGAVILGTEGSMLIDRDGYELYDLGGQQTFKFEKTDKDVSMGVVGGGPMTDSHFQNLAFAIRDGEKLHSPIDEGNVAVTMLQLSNVAWKFNRKLNLNPATGHIVDDEEAAAMWGREYEPGWEPKV